MIRKAIIVVSAMVWVGVVAFLVHTAVRERDTTIWVADGNLHAYADDGGSWWDQIQISPARLYLAISIHPNSRQPSKHWWLGLGPLGLLSLQIIEQPCPASSPTCILYVRFTAPTWMLVAALLSWPVLSVVHGPLRRYRRRRRGLCVNCAYNLTGNESGVCPECGTEVESR